MTILIIFMFVAATATAYGIGADSHDRLLRRQAKENLKKLPKVNKQ